MQFKRLIEFTSVSVFSLIAFASTHSNAQEQTLTLEPVRIQQPEPESAQQPEPVPDQQSVQEPVSNPFQQPAPVQQSFQQPVQQPEIIIGQQQVEPLYREYGLSLIHI